ncbi:MAG: ABC transporter ATP-binding protein [Planctomycetes bacterium]|nr:ABC transporter ATP-binding protein [Planctomycetota bacterium]
MAEAKPEKPRARDLLRRFVLPEGRRHWKLIGVTMACAALASLIRGGQLVIIKLLFDTVVQSTAGSRIVVLGLAILGLELLKSVSSFVSGYASLVVGTAVTEHMRNILFRKVIRLPLSYHLWHSPGEMTPRTVFEANGVQKCLGLLTHQLVEQAVMFFVLLGVIFYLDWQLACMAIVVYPVAGLLFVILGRRLREVTRKSYELSTALSRMVHEALHGIKIVKINCAEERLQQDYAEEAANVTKAQKRIFFASFLLPQLGALLSIIGLLGVLIFGGVRLARESITAGTLVAFLGSMVLFYRPLKLMANLSHHLNGYLAPIERCAEILEEQNPITDTPDAEELPPLTEAICFDNVSFSYDGSTDVLHDVSLEIRAGQTAALVGRSGAGKTTIVNLIPRFYDPAAGRITIDGRDLRSVSVESLRSQLAIVTQETILFSESVRDNIMFGAEERDEERMLEAARLAHVDEFVREMPGGYDAQVGEAGLRLSGGQAQRLCIARAFYARPRILILDEATSQVDSESELLVREAVAKLMETCTTIVIAHRLSTVRRADVLFVVDDGRIVEHGSHDELIRSDGVYAGLCRLQFFSPADSDRG